MTSNLRHTAPHFGSACLFLGLKAPPFLRWTPSNSAPPSPLTGDVKNTLEQTWVLWWGKSGQVPGLEGCTGPAMLSMSQTTGAQTRTICWLFHLHSHLILCQKFVFSITGKKERQKERKKSYSRWVNIIHKVTSQVWIPQLETEEDSTVVVLKKKEWESVQRLSSTKTIFPPGFISPWSTHTRNQSFS